MIYEIKLMLTIKINMKYNGDIRMRSGENYIIEEINIQHIIVYQWNQLQIYHI